MEIVLDFKILISRSMYWFPVKYSYNKRIESEQSKYFFQTENSLNLNFRGMDGEY